MLASLVRLRPVETWESCCSGEDESPLVHGQVPRLTTTVTAHRSPRLPEPFSPNIAPIPYRGVSCRLEVDAERCAHRFEAGVDLGRPSGRSTMLAADVGPAVTTVTVDCYMNEGSTPRNLAISELVFLTQLVRLGTRHRVIFCEVLVPNVPDDLSAYVEYFGITPRQGKVIRVSFASEEATRPFLTANESLWTCFEPELRKRLSSLDVTATMSARVKAVLLEGLPAGEYLVEFAARQLAVSKRTLQRQLKDESTSRVGILNMTRQQLAQHYLDSRSLSQGEIAFLLGFQEVTGIQGLDRRHARGVSA